MVMDEQVARYHADGYIMAPRLFSGQEMELLSRVAREDAGLAAAAYERPDREGGRAKLAVWNDPGDDLYGLFSRSRRVVDTVEKLLGEECYHWHSKMNMKEPRIGGAWAWHQDYGYWYHNFCLWPRLVSVMIAVDRATRTNGCLQLLRGSHLLGRLEHARQEGEQAGADPQRVAQAVAQLELVYCEMEPGDALFFHCNTLHRSDRNNSDAPRWSLICCYNARGNSPYQPTRHPAYTPLRKVDDAAILRYAPAPAGRP
jgi:ectoine hydroxylase